MTDASPSPSRAPLAGVRVLDLTRLLPGPMGDDVAIADIIGTFEDGLFLDDRRQA